MFVRLSRFARFVIRLAGDDGSPDDSGEFMRSGYDAFGLAKSPSENPHIVPHFPVGSAHGLRRHSQDVGDWVGCFSSAEGLTGMAPIPFTTNKETQRAEAKPKERRQSKTDEVIPVAVPPIARSAQSDSRGFRKLHDARYWALRAFRTATGMTSSVFDCRRSLGFASRFHGLFSPNAAMGRAFSYE